MINAKHPLIEKDKVVSNTIELGKDYSILVITGPNTGGKTVTLKTVGLLKVMACSGLNIPAKEGSSIYVFDHIFADIGDDQSINASLSTFSSHMLNIVEITKKATKDSLILLDELGSGTDPLEGANLAISILSNLKALSCLTIATTHYQELKQYALVTSGFKNASVEFDVSTLSPTYKLLIGIPGKSNAFEISEKLGLSKDIIDNAKSLMTKNQVDIENLLKSIYDDKALIESEKEKVLEKSSKIESLEKDIKNRQENLIKKQKDLIDDAKIQARNILLDAKEEASKLIKNLSNISDKKEADKIRNKLNDDINKYKLIKTTENTSSIFKPEEITLNMPVFVKTFRKDGIVLSKPNKSNEVLVEIGQIKINVPISTLEKSKKANNSNNSITNYSSIKKSKNIKSEINVIGQNVEEAVFVVDKFLDDCSLAKLKTARIIHGKGTGKLKTGIHNFLKTNPHVKSFRLGTFGEGEAGVTVVELK